MFGNFKRPKKTGDSFIENDDFIFLFLYCVSSFFILCIRVFINFEILKYLNFEVVLEKLKIFKNHKKTLSMLQRLIRKMKDTIAALSDISGPPIVECLSL